MPHNDFLIPFNDFLNETLMTKTDINAGGLIVCNVGGLSAAKALSVGESCFSGSSGSAVGLQWTILIEQYE